MAKLTLHLSSCCLPTDLYEDNKNLFEIGVGDGIPTTDQIFDHRVSNPTSAIEEEKRRMDFFHHKILPLVVKDYGKAGLEFVKGVTESDEAYGLVLMKYWFNYWWTRNRVNSRRYCNWDGSREGNKDKKKRNDEGNDEKGRGRLR
jgi:hypothetical protein